MLNSIYKKFIDRKRSRFRKKLRSRLTNENFSLIANNCDGGVIYNHLGLKFLSPTVNLYIKDEDYVLFCENLRDFLINGELKEIKSEFDYPVGELSCEKGIAKIYFMHYNSFEEAKQKWFERTKRVNFDNLYFLYEVTDVVDENLIKRFTEINGGEKAIITTNPNVKSPISTYVKIKEDFVFGVMLRYKSKFSSKMYLDEYDYVSFLNKK